MRADLGGRTVRTAALTAGTLGLLAVGLFVMWATPRPGAAPVAVGQQPELIDPHPFGRGAGTAPSEGGAGTVVQAAVTTIDTSAHTATTVLGALATVLPGTPAGDLPATAAVGDTVPVTTLGELLAAALATPFDEGMAFVTAQAVVGLGEGDTLSVELVSGRTGLARVVALLERAAVVALDAELADEPAHQLATDPPTADETVTVLLDEPVRIALSELASLDVPDGTPVVDADGGLIGLCTDSPDGTTVLAAVDAAEGLPATTDPGASAGSTTPADELPPSPGTAPD